MKKLLRVEFCIDVAGTYFRYYVNPWNCHFLPGLGHSVNLLSFLSEKESEALRQINFFSKQRGENVSFYNLLTDDFQILVKNINWNKDFIHIELYRKSIENYDFDLAYNYDDSLNLSSN